jgi:anaphase-promoting complex subunit 2
MRALLLVCLLLVWLLCLLWCVDNDLDVDDETSALNSASSQQEETWQIWENYVTNMLVNFKALPIAKIHMMLNMFLGDEHNATLPALQTFLEHLQRQDKIDFTDGNFVLKSST